MKDKYRDIFLSFYNPDIDHSPADNPKKIKVSGFNDRQEYKKEKERHCIISR